MRFLKESGLQGVSYFLSGPEGFFYRFGDSGFKDKWTGLWHRERKFLEFFAIRERGEWLSEGRCRSLEYDGSSAEHRFSLEGREVSQRLRMRGDSLLLEASCSRPMELELVLAVNIRKRVENLAERPYTTSFRKGELVVGNELGELRLSSPGMQFQPRPESREHSPSGEAQGYFLPGRITARGKRVAFTFSPSVPGERPPRPLQAARPSLISSDCKALEEGFRWSAIASGMCRKGHGWYAGLPWFQQFWSRDFLWSVPSLLSLGYARDVRKGLESLGLASQAGRIPCLVSETEGTRVDSSDPTLLWLDCMHRYARFTGDRAFIRKMERPIIASLGLLSSGGDSNGFVQHDLHHPETWMDTVVRPCAVDIQALLHQALVSGLGLLSMLPSGRGLERDLEGRREAMEGNLESSFFRDGFLTDSIARPLRTANALVPLLAGFREHEKDVLEAIESDAFTTKRGVRTRASTEEGYDPKGYHTGSAWSLTTAWAGAAEFLAGRPEQGWKYLSILMDDAGRDALGCVGECWDSSTGRLTGSPLQLWGSGYIPRLVDEYMLGIDVNCLDRVVRVRPCLPACMSRISRSFTTGLGPVRLSFKRKGREVGVSMSGPLSLVRDDAIY